MSGRGSASRGPSPSRQLNSGMDAATNHLPARSNSMMRRAFPGPKRGPHLQGTAKLQRTQSRRLQESPGSAPMASAVASGPPQQASPSYDLISPTPRISPASAPPSHGGAPGICNWQHTAIDPSLEGNILDPCLQSVSQGFSVDRSVMAEMLNLITDEERASIPVEQATPCGRWGLRGENRENPTYELVTRGLPDKAAYQDYLRSEMEKLVNNFEVEYNAYLQHQDHPSATMKLSALTVPTVESRQSYGPTEGLEALRLLAPEPEKPAFINHDLIPRPEFAWDPSAMPPPPPPPSPHPPPPPTSVAQGFPSFPTGFEGYLPASRLAMSFFQGPTHPHMSPQFPPGPASFPIQMPRQNAPQMNKTQYIQVPTRPDDMVMQAPQVPSNSVPQQVPLMPSFPCPSNFSPSRAPGHLHRRHTTGPSFRQRNMLKRSTPDS